MVLFLLYMKADIESIGSISLRPDVNLRITIKNPLNDYETRENVVFNPSVTVEQDDNAREPAHHFALKWEGNKKTSILQCYNNEKEAASALKKVKKYKGDKPRNYTGDDNGNWVPILAMECRGLEPVSFNPMKDEFIITSEGGVEFNEDIELDQGDWAEYDAENDVPVSIDGLEFKFESV